jgi:hypothetical protein
VADNYLPSTDYDALLGADVHSAAVAAVGVDGVARHAELATAYVQGYLRNSGYAVPAPADLTNDLVRLAVSAAFIELVFAIPDLSQPLPAAWATSISKRALEGILSGDTQLDLPQSVVDAPGGWTMSTSSAATRPQRTSRDEMSGY